MLFVEYFPKCNFPIDNFRSGNFPIVTFSKQHLPRCTSNVKRAFCGATGCNEGPSVAARMALDECCGQDGLEGRVLRLGWARGTSVASRIGQWDECCGQNRLGKFPLGKMHLGKISLYLDNDKDLFGENNAKVFNF